MHKNFSFVTFKFCPFNIQEKSENKTYHPEVTSALCVEVRLAELHGERAGAAAGHKGRTICTVGENETCKPDDCWKETCRWGLLQVGLPSDTTMPPPLPANTRTQEAAAAQQHAEPAAFAEEAAGVVVDPSNECRQCGHVSMAAGVAFPPPMKRRPPWEGWATQPPPTCGHGPSTNDASWPAERLKHTRKIQI